MRKTRNVGRAAIPRRDVPPSPAARPAHPVGTAKVGMAVGKAASMERAHTQVIRPAGADPSRPVFVDPSGVRRRRLAWLAYAIGALLVVTLALVWWSQLGGSSRPPPGNSCPVTATAADPSAPALAPAAGCAR